MHEDKLDASHLLVEILHHRQEDRSQALEICCKMLNLLGQNIPYQNQLSVITQLAQLAATRLSSAFTSDEDYCSMKYTENKRINHIMRFYAQLTIVSYTKGGFMPYFSFLMAYISRFTNGRFGFVDKVGNIVKPGEQILPTFSLCPTYLISESHTSSRYLQRLALCLLYLSVDYVFPRAKGCMFIHSR